MKWIGEIADHPTPKIDMGGISYTLNSRDYKGVLVVVYESNNDRKHEKSCINK